MRRTRRNTVRIIGGQWRSRIIEFPDAADLRPTPDRVRETLFNWLGQDLERHERASICSPAAARSASRRLSRGAASVVMVEKDPAVLRALRENARKLGATNLTVVRGDALEFARNRARASTSYSSILRTVWVLQVAALALARGLLTEAGACTWRARRVSTRRAGWTVLRSARAGSVHFHLLAR